MTGRRSLDFPLSAALAPLLALFTAICQAQAPDAPPAASATAARQLRSDSGSAYVHRLTLYDADGRAISPTDADPQPYSPRVTCGKCHEYARISSGWHFNATRSEIPPGRPSEPWILFEPRLGLQLPMSHRGWFGTSLPGAALSAWQMTQRFGRHMPGGGEAELTVAETEASSEKARWQLAGTREIDCMTCHSQSAAYDAAEAARQIAAQNLRWSATAALGLAAIRGEVKAVPEEFDPLAPASGAASLPKVVYDPNRFDADERVFFDITRRPAADRCEFCHSQKWIGDVSLAPERHAGDVHISAGLSCSDCHRHGIDHDMVRGFRGEARLMGDGARDAYSCEGCHLGPRGGLCAAPHPQHRGLPPLHFEKLSCTACHSGPWPVGNTLRVQTSMAHGLGIASKERDERSPPLIVAPVFARDLDGRIAPFRQMWPAYWARLRADYLEAIAPAALQAAANKVMTRAKPRAGEPVAPLADAEISALLKQLAGDGGPAVYVRDGRLYQLGGDGRLQVTAEPGAAAYRWSLAHDVRPAAQSLGARGCADCHSADAPIYFGSVIPADMRDAPGGPTRMFELHTSDPALAGALGRAFAFRTPLIWIGWVSVGVLALTLLAYALAGLRGLSESFGAEQPR